MNPRPQVRTRAGRVPPHLQWRFPGQREQLGLWSVCSQWYGGRHCAPPAAGWRTRTGKACGVGTDQTEGLLVTCKATVCVFACVCRCGPTIKCSWVSATWCVSTWRTSCPSCLGAASCSWSSPSCSTNTHILDWNWYIHHTSSFLRAEVWLCASKDALKHFFSLSMYSNHCFFVENSVVWNMLQEVQFVFHFFVFSLLTLDF